MLSEMFLAVLSPSTVNKHNQYFNVTHNTHPFFCSTNTHSVLLFAAGLCTFIISQFHMTQDIGVNKFQSQLSKI